MLFGNSKIKRLRKRYESKMKESMEAQRGGDIQGYAELSAEAEALLAKLQALKGERERRM